MKKLIQFFLSFFDSKNVRETTMAKKLRYEDFTISRNELRERIDNYAEIKSNYKPKSGLRFSVKEIKQAFSKATRHLSK